MTGSPGSTSLPEARTARHRRQQELLVAVHRHLREELAQIVEAVQQVRAGGLDPGAARASINAMAIRQNYWTLGAFCAAYCRVVTMHHTIESRAWFPELAAAGSGLGEVVARLDAEHEVIAECLVVLDDALVAVIALVGGPAGTSADHPLSRVEAAVARLETELLTHLDGEEAALLGPLGQVLVDS